MLLAAEQLGDLSGIKREDLSKEGVEQGKQGLVGYLKWLGKTEPKSFAAILGKLIPVQMKVDTLTQTVYRSVEELQRDVAARGLNLRAFGQLLLEAHRAKGEFNAGENDDSNGAHNVSFIPKNGNRS
jgi:hypothetical protein